MAPTPALVAISHKSSSSLLSENYVIDPASHNMLRHFSVPLFRLHGRHDSTFSATLEEMDDLAFFQQLRLSKTAFNYLRSLLPQQEVVVHKRGKKNITLNESLQVTLWFLANKTTFRETSIQFNLSISVTHKIVLSMIKKKLCLVNTLYRVANQL